MFWCSFGVMVLYISTPYLLFLAFDLPYTFFDAAVLHTGIGLTDAEFERLRDRYLEE